MILEPYTKTREPYQSQTVFVPKSRFSASHIRKVSNFITLPAFNIPNTWYGASHIVGKYSFTVPSKFSILSLPARPNDTFCLAVTWGTGPNRFKLWEDIGELFYFDLYGAEIINAQFALEIWNVDGEANAINPGPLIIDTSSLTLPTITNLNCSELSGSDIGSSSATCDNTMTLTGFNPSTEQFSFTNPCAGEQIPL